jgi:hypothetical protein
MTETPAVYEARPIMNPTEEVKYGADAAVKLLEVVRKAGLARKFGGEKEHLYYEAWQTVGKFYGASARTKVDHIKIDDVEGAKATAELIDVDGVVVGGAEAYCMRDEKNWKEKPWFQLASMAQTRAGSKAFRNKFAFVASLAGFAGTPAEEMESIDNREPSKKKVEPPTTQKGETSKDVLYKELSEHCVDAEGLLDTTLRDSIVSQIAHKKDGTPIKSWDELEKVEGEKYEKWFSGMLKKFRER